MRKISGKVLMGKVDLAAATCLAAAVACGAVQPVAELDFGRQDGLWSVTKSPQVQVMEVSALSDDWICRGSGSAYNLFSWRPAAFEPDAQYTLSVRARSFAGSNALNILLMRRRDDGKVVEGEYAARGIVLGREFREYRFPFTTKGVRPAALNFYLNARTDPDKGIDVSAVRLLPGLQTQMEIFPIYRGQRMSRAAGKLPVAGTEVPLARNAYGRSARPLKVLAIGSDERAIRNLQEAFEGLTSVLDVLACKGADQDNFNTDSDPETVKRRIDAGAYDLYALDSTCARRIGRQTAEKILGYVRGGAGLVAGSNGGAGHPSNGHFAETLRSATGTVWNAAHPFPYPRQGTPRVRETRLGKGRVLHVDVPSFKIRPPAEQAGVSDFPHRAFADAWMAKAFLYAAGRGTCGTQDVKAVVCRAFNGDAQGRAHVRAKDVPSALEAAKRALTTAGEHRAMVWLLDGKGETLDCRFFDFVLPGPRLSGFGARADSVAGDEPARFAFTCDAAVPTRATWTLEDFSGRILERGEAPSGAEIAVPTRSLFTNLGIFRLRLWEGAALRDSRTAPVIARDRDAKRLMDDFTVSTWPASRLTSADGEDAVNAALVDIGLRHSLIVNGDAPYQALRKGLGVGGANLGSFARFGANPQKTNAIDNGPINTCAARKAIAEDARSQMSKAARYGVVGAFVCDEPGLVERNARTEPDETPENVAEFRRRMTAKYGAAGARRGPVRLADARANGDFAGYIEWRSFNVDRWCEALRTVADAAHEVDPAMRLSLFNTFGQTAASGNDYWKLLTKAGLGFSHEYTSLVYFGDRPIYNFDEFYRSFRPDMRVWGFTGYGLNRSQIRYTPWWFAAHRYGGCTWFSVWTWEYQLLDIPTLARTEDAAMLAESLAQSQLTDGLGALMLAYDWAPRQAAIYYSHESMLVATLLGTESRSYEIAKEGPLHDYMYSRQGLERTLESLLHQYDYVAPEQVTGGALSNCRVLFLPRIKALSDAEVAALKAFVARGGALMADEMPGAYDELGRKRAAPPFAEGEVRLLGRNFFEKDADCRRQVLDFLSAKGVPQVLGCPDVLKTTGREAMRLTDGVNSLYVVLRMPGRSDDGEEQAFEFPEPGFAFDVRAGRALGRCRNVTARVPSGDAVCWSVCAGEAGRFSVAVPADAKQGDELAFPIRLAMASGRAGKRLFRVRLVRPDGTSHFHLERKLVAEDGVADFRFRMAYNDPVGRWKLQVKDILTGREETFPFGLSEGPRP